MTATGRGLRVCVRARHVAHLRRVRVRQVPDWPATSLSPPLQYRMVQVTTPPPPFPAAALSH